MSAYHLPEDADLVRSVAAGREAAPVATLDSPSSEQPGGIELVCFNGHSSLAGGPLLSVAAPTTRSRLPIDQAGKRLEGRRTHLR